MIENNDEISIEIRPEEAPAPISSGTAETNIWPNSEAMQSIGLLLLNRRHGSLLRPQVNPMNNMTLLSGLSLSFFLASACLSLTNASEAYVAMGGYMLGVVTFIAAVCNCFRENFDWEVPLEPGVPVNRARRLTIAALNPRMSNLRPG